MKMLTTLALAILLTSCTKKPVAREIDCRGNTAAPIAHCDITNKGVVQNCGCVSEYMRDRAVAEYEAAQKSPSDWALELKHP